MLIKNVISFMLFIIFLFSYLLKLIIQARQNKINAVVLGKGSKARDTKLVEHFVRFSTFFWGTTWVIHSFFEKGVNRFFDSLIDFAPLIYLGLGLNAVGVFVFIKAMIDMKSSWRVGIDKEKKSKLISTGIYKYSRNPAFLGFDLMFIGLFLTFPNILTLLVALINIIAMHLLIIQEEKHLQTTFGKDYLDYMKKTPRYLTFG